MKFKRPSTVRPLLYVFAGLAIALLLALLLRPSPMWVSVATVDRNTLVVTVTEEGRTRVRSRYGVAAPVAGRLDRIDLEAGDAVTAGQVIARIDPLPLTSEVRAAQAQLRGLEAQRRGVETQRPKPEALQQAQARIRAAQANQQQAMARTEQAEAALNQAERDRQRADTLQAQGALSQQAREEAVLRATTRARDLEVARRQAQAAAADVAAAREALAILQAEQSDPDYLEEVYAAQMASVKAELARLADEAARTTIRAPASGTVLRVLQESARFVESGTPILEIGNPKDLELVIDVLSTDAVQVKQGDRVWATQWGGGDPLYATVRTIEPSAFTKVSALGVEEQRVNIIAELKAGETRLGDGYRVEAHIVIWEADNVLQVPLSALFRCETEQVDDSHWCAFTVEGGRAQQRTVALGQRNPNAAQVIHGLSENDRVILHPTEQLASGTRVRF
ncbi:efflux RND transporter periplasmic adaptor subunit [Lyngbya confervoides]|uniref:HlyD family efflux transporter periplasmic adaptor subunit n=1 Tax=Lyngbya confervoides BDU141951 TaxID=1574623 RepID=A0ABD4T5P5_9CYAN|nr:HlyD family efflux transporter periplasmic adaptor subunit [Lyngbya confervoides]MCM1983743.1 HlyD family efflux transporter periplasmic adaptor subunit [Lyngbya confervoides BDU141951]